MLGEPGPVMGTGAVPWAQSLQAPCVWALSVGPGDRKPGWRVQLRPPLPDKGLLTVRTEPHWGQSMCWTAFCPQDSLKVIPTAPSSRGYPKASRFCLGRSLPPCGYRELLLGNPS